MQESPSIPKTLCDTHVHVYDCFELGTLLDAAAENFSDAAIAAGLQNYASVIMLTETAQDDCFGRLAEASRHDGNLGTAWSFSATGEPGSLRATRQDGLSLFLLAGRQIVTQENLEILALATTFRCDDGEPAASVVEAVVAAGGVAIAPWGFGKWWGQRGRLLASLTEQFSPGQLALGDNSGRPWFMGTPPQFEAARKEPRRILPGTDPLPFSREASRVGSVGCVLDHALDFERPAADLARRLLDPGIGITPYMSTERLLPFIRNQVGMQLRKHLS